MSNRITGHTDGLNKRQTQALERLLRRRMRADALVTAEFAHHLTYLSEELNRKIGVLVDRRGHVDAVTIGDANRVYLPDVGRQRAGAGRLRGVRLIVTSLKPGTQLITRDELTDLLKLRLDAVVSTLVTPGGRPGEVEYAHVKPSSADADTPWVRHRAHHINALEMDFEFFIRELEAELTRTASRLRDTDGEPALIVHVNTGEQDADSRAREMVELCNSAGLNVIDVIQQRRPNVDRKFVVGRGKLEEIELRCLELGAELLVFSRDLTPAQSRAIAERTELKVLDRTQVILDIFAQRAQSHDGKLQVELAQLKYTLPKLVQRNTAMSRLTGGIGGRGPGETKLEINRRRARDRINRLEKSLDKLGKQRTLRRQRRQRRALPVISLVGYTNAGKSTLLNTLTQAKVDSEDKLFATLDPTSRRLRFPHDREVIITDTVGFIRDLPADLVAAFKATLEELYDADLLLHIVDASDPDFELHIQAVTDILEELELSKKRRVLVFNKTDLIDDPGVSEALASSFDAFPISAINADSTHNLLAHLDHQLWREGHARGAIVEHP